MVVLSWNTRELTLSCLAALERDGFVGGREVVVVDNASADGSVEAIRARFPAVRLVVNQENRLFAAACNQGALAARGEWLCFLNSDTEVSPGALQQLVDFLEAEPAYALAGPQLRSPDGSIQRFCRRLPTVGEALFGIGLLSRVWPGTQVLSRSEMKDFDHAHDTDVEQPMGACMVLRRSEFLDVGGFDEQLSLYYNDVDLCFELRARGRGIRFLAASRVMHHLGSSTARNPSRSRLWWENRSAWFAKRHGILGSLLVQLSLVLVQTGVVLRTTLNPRRGLAVKLAAWGEARRLLRAVRNEASTARMRSRPMATGRPARS